MIKLINFILKPFGLAYTVVSFDEYDCAYDCYRPVYVYRIRRIK